MGTALYNELLTQIRTNTLTAANTTLRDEYVNPAMKFWTLAEGAMLFTYKIRNKGIVTQTSDNANPAPISEIDRLVKIFEAKAQAYSERITRFLIENDTTYPLYTDAGDGVDTIHPKRDNYNIGWYMGNTKGKYNPCANGDENTIPF